MSPGAVIGTAAGGDNLVIRGEATMTMNRRAAIGSAAGVMAAAAWGQPGRASWQKPFEEMTLPELMKAALPSIGAVPVETRPLAANLDLITGPGGNVTLLHGPDGVLMVDSFVPGHGDALLAAARKRRAEGPITLVDTHWHFDHAGGNAALGAAGAKIVAHTTARQRLGSDQFMSDLGQAIPKSPAVALPVVTIEDAATYYLNGEEVRLQHVAPAHTDGDIFIHYRNANILQTGDLLTIGGYCNIDSSSQGWITGMVAACDLILGLVDARTVIVPGHGPVGNRDDLKAFRSMLAGVRDAIQPMVEAGKTVDEVIAAKPTAPFDAKFAGGLFKGRHFAELAYNGLRKYHEAKATR